MLPTKLFDAHVCSSVCVPAEDEASGELHVELFCNPNAHSTAFDAQVLVTLRGSNGFKLVGEASLEQVRSSIAIVLQSMRQESM